MKKNFKKLLGFMVFAFAMIPMINVSALEVTDEATLRKALEAGGEITLANDIEVTAPLYANKEATIDGAGHKITAADAFVNDGGNGSILAVMTDAEVLLQDLTIDKAKKYGVQAYNGGIVTFNGVTITNSGFGAVLVNGGGAIVMDLTMNDNAYGIEFGKGVAVTEEPALLMAGTINGTQKDLLVLATNDNLGTVTVGNMPDSEMKLAVDGKTLVLKDKAGQTVATSNEASGNVVVEEEEVEVPGPTPTPTPTPTPDTTVTENPDTSDSIMSYVVLAILGLGALGISSKKLLSE